MKVVIGVCAAALLLLVVAPGLAGPLPPAPVWSDTAETFHGSLAEEECKCVPDPPWDLMEPLWIAGPNSSREFINAGSMTPDGDWAYGKEDWAGDWYDVRQAPVNGPSLPGASSAEFDPSGGSYADIFVTREFPTVQGDQYTFCFDLSLDNGLLGGNPPGQQTGDDHQSSVAWQIRNTVENTLETTSLGRQSPAAIADTEDYPGHLRNSIWIGAPGMWDGNWHTHCIDFTAEGDWAVFALKLRSHGADSGAVMRIDNLTLIPEPASLALLALGGLIALRRRRQ